MENMEAQRRLWTSAGCGTWPHLFTAILDLSRWMLQSNKTLSKREQVCNSDNSRQARRKAQGIIYDHNPENKVSHWETFRSDPAPEQSEKWISKGMREMGWRSVQQGSLEVAWTLHPRWPSRRIASVNAILLHTQSRDSSAKEEVVQKDRKGAHATSQRKKMPVGFSYFNISIRSRLVTYFRFGSPHSKNKYSTGL